MLNNIRKNALIFILFVSVFVLAGSGCTTIVVQKGKRSNIEKIKALRRHLSELGATKNLLAQRLEREIKQKQVKLNMADKGLVITFVADVLFDSGKAKLRPSAYATLDKVARVLKENVPGMNIGIEGHTDNVPIKHSPWRSNWELSAQRALSVLHYLVDRKGIRGERASAIGYGKFRPVASNDTRRGRQKNRRVEIVILANINKVSPAGEEYSGENFK
ncbi:MAG: flagellar motor protein MotB [Candidatus Omnitrophota bacterium]